MSKTENDIKTKSFLNKGMNKKNIGLIGIFVVLFSLAILFSNPLDFTQFPSNLSFGAIIGVILLLIGLWAVWNGFKEE